jgi:hypothetical protein
MQIKELHSYNKYTHEECKRLWRRKIFTFLSTAMNEQKKLLVLVRVS